MKKFYYLLALAAMAFTACQKEPIVAVPSLTKTAALTLTLATPDYQLLPTTAYPHASYNFNTTADANTYISTILNLKESAQLNNGSTATVTYNLAPPAASVAAAAIKIPDTLFKDVSYTVTNADLVIANGATATGAPKFTDLTPAQVLTFLKVKYPTPVANQLAVITYTLFTGVDALVTNSFLYLNGAWQKIYQISPTQYTALNLGSNDFAASNVPNLPAYFNGFLKADPSIIDTIHVNDIEYVSYKYFVSAANTFQRVMGLTYDGNNFVPIPAQTQATGSFLKTNGTWAAVVPVPSINYTLSAADILLISNSTFGTSTLRANLLKFGDWETGATGWALADIQNAIILVLTTDFPKPVLNENYNVTYLAFIGGADVPTVLTFQNNGTAWVAH